MPKVSYTNSKGLFQETGTGVTLPVRRPVTSLTNAAVVARTLTVAESGTMFKCALATVDNNITLTLPTATTAAGCRYDVMINVNSDDGADLIITTGANGTDIFGGVVRGGANSTITDVPGKSKLTVDGSASQATKGTRFTLECDGTHWRLSGYCPVVIGTAVLTLADAA